MSGEKNTLSHVRIVNSLPSLRSYASSALLTTCLDFSELILLTLLHSERPKLYTV